MDSYRANKDEIGDLYPRPASAGCVNSNWCSSDPSSSLFGSSSGERLEHLVKSRPRKPKSRAPTRISIISMSSSISSTSSSSSSTSNVDVKNSFCPNGRLKSNPSTSGMSVVSDRIDDGLDTFFCKPTIPTTTESITRTAVTISTTPPPTTTTVTTSTIKLSTTTNAIPKIMKQSVKQPPSSNVNIDKLQEKSTTSSKSPTKAIQKIIKSFEIRVNRESVK